MKPMIPSLLLLALGSAQAAPIAMEDQSQLKVPGSHAPAMFTPPSETDLPDNAFGKMVREGHALFVDTRRLMPEAVGNGMNCSNCHLDQGRLAYSAPLWGRIRCIRLIARRTTRSTLLPSVSKAVSSSA